MSDLVKPLTRDDAEFQVFLEAIWHLVFFSYKHHVRPTVAAYYLIDARHLPTDLTRGKSLEFNANVAVLVDEDGSMRVSKNRYGELDEVHPKLLEILSNDYAVREVHET